MNRLSQAAEILKGGWCKGAYREELDDIGESFCAEGALGVTFLEQRLPDSWNDWSVKDYLTWGNATNAATDSRETQVLAQVIKDNYPHVISIQEESESEEVVFLFNDRVAESSDEVVAMFEKAAVVFDETA